MIHIQDPSHLGGDQPPSHSLSSSHPQNKTLGPRLGDDATHMSLLHSQQPTANNTVTYELELKQSFQKAILLNPTLMLIWFEQLCPG